MKNEGVMRYRSEADRGYWRWFEARLATKAATRDARARRDLLTASYSDTTGSAVGAISPRDRADLAYRMRYCLGPTISAETLADVKARSADEARSLLRRGVSPQLLGLDGEAWSGGR